MAKGKQTLTTNLIGRLVVAAQETVAGISYRKYTGGWNAKNSPHGLIVGTYLKDGEPVFMVEADGEIFATFPGAVEIINERNNDLITRSVPTWDSLDLADRDKVFAAKKKVKT